MVQVLLRNQFVDAVENVQIRVYIQQVHMKTLQEALARGLKLESILQSTKRVTSPNDTKTPYRAKRRHMERSPVQSHRSSPQPRRSPPRGKLLWMWTSRAQSKDEGNPVGLVSVAKNQPIHMGPRSVGVALQAPVPSRYRERQMVGKPCNLMVERTFLHKEAIAAVADLGQPEQQLCGITGHCTLLKGLVLATIAVRGEDRTLIVYVADIEEKLPGLDYLQESEVVLDFRDMTMEVGNRKEPLWCTSVRSMSHSHPPDVGSQSLLLPQQEDGGRKKSGQFNPVMTTQRNSGWQDLGSPRDGGAMPSTGRCIDGDV
ncbi:hypothetical protein E2C01_063869 [Portunus trituberculatus]|uniref:Uncharacterized protein n=1 Tax=Portunus trituberculatus TaxID=210409 RepID=A0A5B7HIU2_PORTR|nr:hypothetical protein [Portunus trituberculatus]